MDRAERASPHRFGVAGQRATAHTGGDIQQLHRMVRTAAEDGVAICGVETAREYSTSVADEIADARPCCNGPELDCFVVAT